MELLNRLIHGLDALEIEYRIKLPSGEVIGKLDETPPLRKKSAFPYGAMAEYYEPLLQPLTEGGKVEIPARELAAKLQNSVTGWCALRWGRGKYMTSFDRKTNILTVIRV